jgi:hypothetical protein
MDRPGKAIKMAPRDRSVAWEALVEPLSRVALAWRPRSHHKLVYVVVVTVVQAVDLAQPSVPACPLPIAYASPGEARYPAGGEVPPRGRGQRYRQSREHDSRFSESIVRPTRTARRPCAHARVRREKVMAPSSPPNPKSANLEVHTSTIARSAETSEGGEMRYPTRILLQGSVQTYPDTP